MSTAIIVAGMHRSGTSATSGALRHAGVALGGELLSGGMDNPKGYFENRRAVEIHEKLLGDLGSSWDDVRALPDGWISSEAAAAARQSIKDLIAEEFSPHDLWAIKDPRICRFLPLWREVLEESGINTVVLLVVRRPAEVAASIKSRNGWQRPIGELLWMRHVFESEAASAGLPRSVISYDNLLADPFGALVRSLGPLGIKLQGAGAVDALKKFVDSGERHHDAAATRADGKFLDLLDEVYSRLVAIEHGADEWDAVRKLATHADALLDGWAPFIDAVASQAARHLADLRAVQVRNYQVQSDLNAQIAWSERAVVREEELRLQLGTHLREESIQAYSQLLNEALQPRIDSLQSMVDTGRLAIEKLEASNAALAETIKAERERWTGQLQEAIRESSRQQARNEHLELENARISAVVAESERDRHQMAACVSELEAEAVRLAASNSARFSELEAEAARLAASNAARVSELEAEIVRLERELQAAASQVSASTAVNEELSRQLEKMSGSLSWRLSAPLRKIRGYFH